MSSNAVVQNPSLEAAGSNGHRKYHGEVPCDGPGCAVLVPAGWVAAHRKLFFHSEWCRNNYYRHNHYVGDCFVCGGKMMAGAWERNKRKYCSAKCEAIELDRTTLGRTGPFRSTIEKYLKEFVPVHYAPGRAPQIKFSLWRFFGFAFEQEHLTAFEQIKPACLTHFIAWERGRGVVSSEYIGSLTTFWRWLRAEGLDVECPVVPRLHNLKVNVCLPRPYSSHELEYLERAIRDSGSLVMLVAFLIGKECGLRIGEACNIRIPDIELEKRKIFVRLPTKNRETRTVPFHYGVAEALQQWLTLRPNNPHDHLLCNRDGNPLTKDVLHSHYRQLFHGLPEPAKSFKFHRLRHSWATTLLNCGMEIATLKVLGGWKSWNNLARYTKIHDATVERQYADAYTVMQNKDESDDSESMSLEDFALIDSPVEVNPANSAS